MDALLLTLVLLQPPSLKHCWVTATEFRCDDGTRALLSDIDAPHEPTLLHALIGAAMVAHGADLATTMYCRGARTCAEANPALRWLQDDPVAFAAVKMGLAAGTSYALLRLHRSHPRIVTVMAVAQVGAFSYVAWRNRRQGARD